MQQSSLGASIWFLLPNLQSFIAYLNDAPKSDTLVALS